MGAKCVSKLPQPQPLGPACAHQCGHQASLPFENMRCDHEFRTSPSDMSVVLAMESHVQPPDDDAFWYDVFDPSRQRSETLGNSYFEREIDELRKGAGKHELAALRALSSAYAPPARGCVLSGGSSDSASTSASASDASILLADGWRPVHRFLTGATYLGEWKRGARHGHGLQKWQDGSEYHGQWNMDKAQGLGRFRHADGELYYGEWLGNAAHGAGVYYRSDGTKYLGEWRKDAQHGLGVEIASDGACYRGEFSVGKKSGVGVYTWADGPSYSGAWLENCVEGLGAYAGANGWSYHGQWQSSAFNGIGLHRWGDDRTYAGRYVRDTKEGFGVFSWPDGRMYQGWYKNGKHIPPALVTTATGETTEITGYSLSMAEATLQIIDALRTEWV